MTFLRYKLLWEMVKEVRGYIKFYHLVNKNERFSTTLLMRPSQAGDELSFYFFVLSQLSVEMRRRSSLRKVLTPRLCLSLVTIRTICVLILTESLLRHDSDDDPYFTYTPILLLLHTLIWYILCNRKTQWHPPQRGSPTTCNGFIMGGNVSPVLCIWCDFYVSR